MDEQCFLFFYGIEGQKSEYSYWGKKYLVLGKELFWRKECEYTQYTQNTIMSPVELKCLSGFAKRYLPEFPIDLHPSKPLISLVPITCTTYCFQGYGHGYVTIPIVFPANHKTFLEQVQVGPKFQVPFNDLILEANEKQMKVFSQGLKPQFYC